MTGNRATPIDPLAVIARSFAAVGAAALLAARYKWVGSGTDLAHDAQIAAERLLAIAAGNEVLAEHSAGDPCRCGSSEACKLHEGCRDPGKPSLSAYPEPLSKFGDLMTRERWLYGVQHNMLMDDDGSGRAVKDGKMGCFICPSQADQLPDDATHVMWFNK